MKYLKKNIIWIGLLVLIDQLIKFVIYKNCMDADVPLILDLVAFRPLRNTDLSWAGNYFSISRNPIFLYTLNIIGLILVPAIYNYLWKTTLSENRIRRMSYAVLMAGIICSFFDKLGGGSIDYIGLKNLFTFDLKDCYLSMGEVCIILYVILHWKTVKELKLRDILHFYQKKQEQ